MPRGIISKVDMLAYLYRQKRDLPYLCNSKHYTFRECQVASEVLDRVLDYVNEFSN